MLQIKNTNINEDVISSVAEMWHLEEFLDVTLICMDGAVRSSKMVLAAHSPLLKAILDHPDKDHILLLEYTRNTVEFLVSVLHGHCPRWDEWKKMRIEEIVSLDSTLDLHTSFHSLFQSYLENDSFLTNNYNEEFVQFTTKNEEVLNKIEISSKLSLQVADELYSKDDNESVASDLTIALDAFENELEDSDDNLDDEPTHEKSASDDKLTDCINTDIETKCAKVEGSRRMLRKFDSDDEETEKERFVSEEEASHLCSPYITKSETNDSGKSKYTCKKCLYSHADEKPVFNHVCCHLNIFTIKCNICGQLERQPPNMEKHLNKHHGLTREEDKKDDFTLITPNQCTLSIMPQRFIPYLCEFCAKPLKGKKMADEHNEVCGRGQKNTWFSIVGRGLFQCNTCQEVCKGKLLLKSHLAYTHNQTLPFYCDQCGDSFFTESSLNIHFDSYHGGGNKKKGKVSKDDNEDINSVNSMVGNYHLRKHYTYIPMKQAVPIIETYFQGEKDEFLCKICQAVELTKNQIRNHLLDNHLKLFLFKCELCSKKVKKEDDYKMHMLKEHGIDNENPIDIMNDVSIDAGLYLVQQDQVLVDEKSTSEGVNNVDSGAVNAESMGSHDQLITILKKDHNHVEESDISNATIKIMQSNEPIQLQVTESMEQPENELVAIQDIISSTDSHEKNKEEVDTLTNPNVEIDITNAIIAQHELLKNKPEDAQLNNPSWVKENSANVYKPKTNKIPKSLITPSKEKNKRVDKVYVDDADEPLLGKGSKKLDKLISGKVFEEQEAEELVQKHVSKTVLDRQYKCGLCDFSTPKLEFARIHIYDHFGVYFYQCDKCKDLFRKRAHYDRHLLSHKVREEKGKLLDQDKVGNYHLAKSMTYIPIKKARPIIDTYFSRDEDSGTLACKLCQFSAQENKDMRHHLLRYHLKLNVYKCKICAEQFQVEYDLKKHVKVDHETNYEKELSDKVDHPEFDSQETEIEAEDILKVPMEQLKGKKISTAQGRILRKQHITRNELENLYECELCDFKKAFAVQLSDHVMSAHYDVFIYKCSMESCGKLLRNWSRYSTHKKTHEAEKKEKKGQTGGEKKKPFRKGTFTIDEEYHLLEQDLYVGKEEGLRIAREYFYYDDISEKYKCKMCKYIGRHQTVEQHVLAQHLKMLYLFKCDYCDKQIRYSETAFKDHLLLHTVGKLPCPHCQEMDVGAEKRFTKASLAAHLRRIHTAGEFPCGVEGCGLAMATVADLKMHQRQVHFMGLPPQKIRYMCQICGYTFPKKQQLEWHVTSCQAGRSRSRFRQGIADCLTWLGQGVYRCNFCEMDFHPPRETASSLPLARKHVVSVHKMNHLRRAKMSWTQGIQGQTPRKVKKRKQKEMAREEEGGELEKEMLSPKGKVRVINTYYNVHAQ